MRTLGAQFQPATLRRPADARPDYCGQIGADRAGLADHGATSLALSLSQARTAPTARILPTVRIGYV